MEENIIVCRTADGDLTAYDSFADAVANSVENSDKDIAEIAITANDNYKCIITRKIGRKGLLLHDILEDKNATDAEKEDARKQLDTPIPPSARLCGKRRPTVSGCWRMTVM